MKLVAAIVAYVILYVLALAFLTLDAWLGIQVIAGHDVSFREAVGVGFLLSVAAGTGRDIAEGLR